MSTALSQALYARLAGIEALSGRAAAAQAALGALLGVDPDTGRPAVYFGAKNDAPAVYPILAFHPAASQIDGRFADGAAIDSTLYDIEVWETTRLGSLLTDILEQLEQLLDLRRGTAPALPLAVGHIYWSESLVTAASLYDPLLNAWFALARYRFVEARY